MKDIRPALRAFLLADAAIAALVSTRIYPIRIPAGIKAASIVYARVSGAGDYSMEGPSGLAQHRLQLDSWALSSDAAVTLANLVKVRVDGYSGVMGTGGNAVNVQGVFQTDLREDYDAATELHRVGRDFMFAYEEL